MLRKYIFFCFHSLIYVTFVLHNLVGRKQMLDRTFNLKLKVYDVAAFLLKVNLVLSGKLGNIFRRLTIRLIATYLYFKQKR